MRITDGTNTLGVFHGSTTAQAVSTTCQYTWAVDLALTGQVGATTAVTSHGTLPRGLILPAASVIASLTVGIAATGDYGAPVFTYIER